MNYCINCENEFESKTGRAKFCSDLCRATFYQNTKNGQLVIKIYGLVNPISNQIFYVGKTVGTLTQRLSAHIKDKEGNIKKRAVIKDIIKEGYSPQIIELERFACSSEEEELTALMREEYWIKFYKEQNQFLCNSHGTRIAFKPRFLSEYAKSSSKTGSSSVRFDKEKMEFIMGRENITNKQQVLDFLVNKYWWEFNGMIHTRKESPLANLKKGNQKVVVRDLNKEAEPFGQKLDIAEMVRRNEEKRKLQELKKQH